MHIRHLGQIGLIPFFIVHGCEWNSIIIEIQNQTIGTVQVPRDGHTVTCMIIAVRGWKARRIRPVQPSHKHPHAFVGLIICHLYFILPVVSWQMVYLRFGRNLIERSQIKEIEPVLYRQLCGFFGSCIIEIRLDRIESVVKMERNCGLFIIVLIQHANRNGLSGRVTIISSNRHRQRVILYFTVSSNPVRMDG
ncbi:hypothetical protein D1872_202390 [compost metagenome]